MYYLTIREFGSLRGVSVGSLRYYEKLGLLKPARVDPHTGYRYYLPEQLDILDAIQMCVALDIPLKDLTGYINAEGELDLKGILNRGRQVLMDKLDQMNTTLKMTEYGLNMMEKNEAYHGRKDVYHRRIEERWCCIYPASGDIKKLQEEQKQLLQHFRKLQEKNMAPFFPAGLILRPDGTGTKKFYFLRILHPGHPDPDTIRIPAGSFSCLQRDITDKADACRISGVLDEYFPERGRKPVIITNMMTEKMHYKSWLSEIQVPDEYPA